MGFAEPGTGQSGEEFVQACLRERFFFDVTPGQQAGSAVDIKCTELRASPGSDRSFDDPFNDGITFNISVKSGDSFPASGIGVRRRTFDHWLSRIEEQPLILVWRTKRTMFDFSFLPLHDWLLTAAAQPILASRTRNPRFSVKGEFQADKWADGQALHAVLVEEQRRVSRHRGALWSTLGDYGLFPFREATFLRYLELAEFAEVPREVLRELSLDTIASVPRSFDALLNGPTKRQESALMEWFTTVQLLAPGASETSAQRRHFLDFVHAMQSHQQGRPVRFPEFHASAIRSWRSFVTMYPASLGMLERALLKPSQDAQGISFAVTLLPLLSNSADRIVSGQAMDLARAVNAQLFPFTSWEFRRNLHRSLAEAGVESSKETIVDIVRESPEQERGALTRYGWPRDRWEQLFRSKIDHPSLRDEQLLRFYEASAEVLLPGAAKLIVPDRRPSRPSRLGAPPAA